MKNITSTYLRKNTKFNTFTIHFFKLLDRNCFAVSWYLIYAQANEIIIGIKQVFYWFIFILLEYRLAKKLITNNCKA